MPPLTVKRPVSPNRVLQPFGSNDVCCKLQDNGVFPIMPFRLRRKQGGVCPRGYKEFYPFTGKRGHDGRDWWGIWWFTKVYFSANYEGWLKYASDGDGGIGVEIVSKKPILKCGEVGCAQVHHIKKRYWHLSKRYGVEGQIVQSGDLIGRVGNSGASSGVHLHESTMWCDSTGKIVHSDNGYSGAFDDKKYFENVFINDKIIRDGASPSTTKMSTTYIAQIVSMAAWVFTLMGIDVGIEALNTTVTTIIAIATGLYVFYGRYRAGGITALGTRAPQK